MKRAGVSLLGLLLAVGLLSCAGSPEAKAPEDSSAGTEDKSAAVGSESIEEPVAEPAEGPAGELAPADMGDLGSGDIGSGDIGNGEYGNGDIGDGAEAYGGIGDGEPESAGLGMRGSEGGAERLEWAEPGEAAPPAPKSSPRASRAPAQASGLKAGYADDNRQYNYFLQFLREYAAQVPNHPMPVDERIVLRARDQRGKPLANVEVRVFAPGGAELARGLTYADGSFLFFPSEHGQHDRYRARASFGPASRELWFEREGRREVLLDFDLARPAVQSAPLDLLFVLDTTGSMGEEIQRLRTTIELINLNLTSLSSRPRVRFGMVLYKDRGDEYVTLTVPFTEDLDSFQASLDRVNAEGGGDDPEDLQAALREAMRQPWSRGGVRLAFVITDAAPHLDYGQDYTYADAAREARAQGIKVFGVGTGGLDLAGEYVLRQVAQYTAAKYIFLTYGEQGESEGGAPGSVSHHTGANFQTDKLEAIIIRFAKEELAFLSDQPLEEEEDYFQASRVEEEQKGETLEKLFGMAISQLIDYSTFRLPPDTPAAVLPLAPASPELALPAEYFTEALVLSFGRGEAGRKTFRVLERRDLQSILSELELALSGLAEEGPAAKVGKLLGARVLVVGRLYPKGQAYELFLKLLWVENGEVLSATKALIDRRLGIEG
jgi:Mg-chelatase subunit ChlD